MDIRQLEYFTTVAKHASFTKAAAHLHVSQPSLSKAIKGIENELEVPLFYRSSKKLELTDAGKAVFGHAMKVLEEFQNLTDKVSDLIEYKSGNIRIGIPPIIGAAFFSKLISHFKETYPLIDIMLTEVGSKLIKQGVEDGSLDIGLICNVPVQNNRFEMIELLKDPLVLITHCDHPFTKLWEIQLADLKEQHFILYQKDFSLHDRIIEEFAKHSICPNVVCESSQKDFMVEMVGAKLGVALLPSKIAHEIKHPYVRAFPIVDSQMELELAIIWKKNKYTPFSLREFVRMSGQFLS